MVVSDHDVHAVQTAYPQIYFACHTRHQRRRSSPAGLSAADGTVLAHLGREPGPTLSGLARHLSLGKPTVSAALKRLETLGYVARHTDEMDRRVVRLSLTERGVVAARRTSVLDGIRVRRLLARLTTTERRRAIDGLTLLATAASREPRGKST